MDDTREQIARMIKQISQREMDLKLLIPSQLESLVAELSSQYRYIDEIKRTISPQADLLLSIRDQKNIISKYAIEVKQAQKLIDSSAVESFRKHIENLHIERGFLVTNSLFTESAKKLAEDYRNTIQLIDHDALLNWTNQYQTIQEQFASSLFFKYFSTSASQLTCCQRRGNNKRRDRRTHQSDIASRSPRENC